MRPASVAVVTDRPDRGRALVEAVRTVAECRVTGPGEFWPGLGPVQGVIADLALDRPEATRCLGLLSAEIGTRRLPLICLTRAHGDAALREARRMGASACFPALTEPSRIVAALFRQIAPEKTLTDLLVEHAVARTGMLLTDMFDAARSGRADPVAIDEGVEPILHAVREGDLTRWLDLVQRHDDTTLRHCLLVAGLVAHFATRLGLPASDRAALVRAGLVHDVGKARIPLAILNKPGPLDAHEMAVMRTHAAIGHEILVASGLDDPLVLAATRHHHEMLDGSGYPDGLRGDEIDDPIRLLTICDIYAALTERRPYRPPMPQAEALRILRGMTGKLEPALVEAFAASLTGGEVRRTASGTALSSCIEEAP